MPLSSEEIHRIYDMLAQYHRAYLAQAESHCPLCKEVMPIPRTLSPWCTWPETIPTPMWCPRRSSPPLSVSITPAPTMSSRHAIWPPRRGGISSPAPGAIWASRELKAGEYRLKTLTEHYPGFTALAQAGGGGGLVGEAEGGVRLLLRLLRLPGGGTPPVLEEHHHQTADGDIWIPAGLWDRTTPSPSVRSATALTVTTGSMTKKAVSQVWPAPPLYCEAPQLSSGKSGNS